jgi:hypothetical protein
MSPNRRPALLAAELRPVLALARMDCVAALSSQVDGLVERAVRQPRRAVDPAWWAAELGGPARAFDDAWARGSGPVSRRAVAAGALRHRRVEVTRITHGVSRPAGPLLISAATGALPRPRPRRRPSPARPGRRGAPGAGLSGAVLSGTVLSGSAVSGLAGAGRALPAAWPGALLVLSGVLLLVGAGAGLRVRAVREARAREVAARVRAAVLATAERELVRRSLDVERAAGAPEPPVTGVRAALRGVVTGVGRGTGAAAGTGRAA